MSCSGLCDDLEYFSIYQPLKQGQKKCRICKKVFETKQIKCPCCNNFLSTRSRTPGKRKILVEIQNG